MTISELRELLDSNPDARLESDYGSEIDSSIAYLESAEALASLERDPYWPKWHSPWWHMLTLQEMGLARLIPKSSLNVLVAAVDRLPVKFFPIDHHEWEEGVDPVWDVMCHCQAGSLYTMLSNAGVSVSAEMPWLRHWLSSYQMADGGMSCDEGAYRVEGQCPSSMVGLVAPFEAVLQHTRSLLDGERRFLDRGAGFLIGRQLRQGSSSAYNASERESAPRWLLPCFPRLYFYDVLRGLHALLSWCEKRERRVPLDAVGDVVEHLARLAPDGKMPCARHAYEGTRTRIPSADRNKVTREAASMFPLLQAVSRIGTFSPFLTRQWTECKRLLRQLPIETAPSAVTLVPPAPEWESLALQESERLAALLGENLIAVHHIGSTSIPGIWAKPVIDLAPEVRDIEAVDAQEAVLRAAGFEYWGEYGLPGRRFLPLVDPARGRIANVHCYQTGTPELFRHLAFRDYMRAHPHLAREYEKVKLKARDLFPFDVFGYNDEKNPWIREKERDAIAWAQRGL